MTERETARFSRGAEFRYPILSEMPRPHPVDLELYDYGEAVLVDKKIILAYKLININREGAKDKIFVGRERTMPVVIERKGNEFCFPYPNEDELRGRYGVLFISVSQDYPIFYVSEQYKVTFEGAYFEEGYHSANILLESTKSIETEMIDGSLDYNEYLKALSSQS